MKIRLAAPLQVASIVDGKGMRMVVWNQGCRMACPGCHNPETQDMCGGCLVDIDNIKKDIQKNAKYHQGITLSGGDPFLQPEANIELAKYAHSLGLDVWAYCGKTFEQLKSDERTLALLKECDVLVDGPFIIGQRDLTLPFRGSANQRIIDVPGSLWLNKVIIYD